MTTLGRALTTIFREAMDADYHDATWFKDNDPGGSFIPSLDQLSAVQASESPVCGRNSIAPHARHISFHFQALIDYLRSREWQEKLDWESTWRRQDIDEEEWIALRTLLRQQVEEVHGYMSQIPEDAGEDVLTGAVALIAHCSYHLGAVRQIGARSFNHAP